MSGAGQDTLVFISYSRTDTAFAEKLKQDLRQAGATIWIDHENLPPGHPDWQAAIRRGIAAASAFIYVGSPDAAISPNVGAEVQIAKEDERAGASLSVIPIWARGEPWSNCAPFELIRANYLDARGDKYPAARDTLLKALGSPIPGARPEPAPFAPPTSRYPLPDVPARLTSLGFSGVNVNDTPAIVPPLITIPAGPFLMGSDKTKDRQAKDNEVPQHRVEVAAFQIAKYPVTVAEYALAVRSGAVAEPPRFSTTTWQRQQQYPNHPVVCVSWLDAEVYAAWLSAVTGQFGWRLPTEAEWEKAARWDDKLGHSYIYPWSDGFDSHRCNTKESGIETTSQIGSYPATDNYRSGVSRLGAEEMAGNVWEWTSSLHNPFPYVETDGRENANLAGRRVLRGGSWNDYAVEARCAHRESAEADVLYGTWDFRLALNSTSVKPRRDDTWSLG